MTEPPLSGYQSGNRCATPGVNHSTAWSYEDLPSSGNLDCLPFAGLFQRLEATLSLSSLS
ncbi:hypothetical protein PROFUN_01661 [Planoprotostelium fungivorum]|uniref:Uncharacterized protein n=1 Tax=Planoprotostelium fungivorum TaxID=1890364 RepID=A0A2P6MW67_9EUKA|nr:hypothetical protein PROFUN_01661 [Planoprotostelium fungivorum]